MPRVTLDREIRRLQDETLALESMVAEAVTASVRQLKQKDLEGSRNLVAGDREINARRFAIEADVLALIATQQPAAVDLRTLAAILEIVTELERIGDYAKGIARINLMIGEKPFVKPIIDLPLMAAKSMEMLREALDAFVRRDAERARAIPSRDDEIDALYNQVYHELIALVMADHRAIDQANYLLWVAHNLERSADRVTNICERVVFMVTGEMAELDREGNGLEGLT